MLLIQNVWIYYGIFFFTLKFNLLHFLKLTRYFKHVIKQYILNAYHLSKKLEWFPMHVFSLVNMDKCYFLKHNPGKWG